MVELFFVGSKCLRLIQLPEECRFDVFANFQRVIFRFHCSISREYSCMIHVFTFLYKCLYSNYSESWNHIYMFDTIVYAQITLNHQDISKQYYHMNQYQFVSVYSFFFRNQLFKWNTSLGVFQLKQPRIPGVTDVRFEGAVQREGRLILISAGRDNQNNQSDIWIPCTILNSPEYHLQYILVVYHITS